MTTPLDFSTEISENDDQMFDSVVKLSDQDYSFLDDEQLFIEENGEPLSPSASEVKADTTWQRWKSVQYKVLWLSSLPIILQPLCLTIIFPALTIIQDHFDANEAIVSLNITLFNLFCALGGLFFGPLSDFLGRKKVLQYSLPLFG